MTLVYTRTLGKSRPLVSGSTSHEARALASRASVVAVVAIVYFF